MFQKLVDLLKPNVSIEAKLTGVTVTVGKDLDRIHEKLDTLEIKTLIPLKDGADGKIGPRGLKGDKGDPGKDGIGRDGKDGNDGRDGASGKDGKAGENGVSVVGADIAPDEHLVLNLSNGNIIDAGKLPKAKAAAGKDRVHVAGNSYQIAVSATAPSNPQVNDLWLDIS